MLSCASPFNAQSRRIKKGSPAGSSTNAPPNEVKIRPSVKGPSPAVAVPLPERDLAVAVHPLVSQLYRYSKEDLAGTIAIVGPAGVGKTTILKQFNHEFLKSDTKDEEHRYDLVIFAPVAQGDSNLLFKRLQSVIARRLSLPCQKNESQDITSIRISIALQDMTFVLLLDGLQQYVDLTKIGIPLPDGRNKCKIIFTTRLRQAANDMKADKVVEVPPFDSKGSWELFQRCVGEKASSPDTIDVAKSFARECGGIALSLITVGKSLVSVSTREEWMRCLQKFRSLKEHLSSIKGGGGEGTESATPISSLYFSYAMLGADEQNCLLYCSLYPKDHSIRTEELIRYWTGEGLILRKQGSIKGARREGYELIARLEALHLLVVGNDPDSEVIMHDIMHDLALIIAKEKSLLVQAAGQKLVKVPAGIISEDTRKVSLMYNAIETLDGFPPAPHLQSLILRSNHPLGEIKHDLSSFESLQLLDLSHTRLRKVPSKIGNLVWLTYLDLSYTKIKVLPQEVENLVNLVQLLLQGTRSLTRIPGGIISKLTKVLVLNLHDSYADWEVASTAATTTTTTEEEEKEEEEEDANHHHRNRNIHNSASIEELKCMEQLNELGITISSTQALESFVDSAALTSSTRYLSVNECEDLKKLHLSKSRFKKLQQVTISDCGALEEFVVGGCSSSHNEDGRFDWRLSNLEVLRLKSLYKVVITWRGMSDYSDYLPNLRELDISFCNELKDVSWILWLTRLQRIKLNSCKSIEHVSVAEGGALSAATEGKLDRLRSITLRNLPRLKSIYDHPLSLPLLESVKVLGCPKLKSLPQRTGNDSSPVFVYGEKEWWNAVKSPPSFWCFQATKQLCWP